MFTFALRFFLQAIDIFLFIFNLFPLFAAREEGICKKSYTTKTNDHKITTTVKSGVECQTDRFACFAAYV